MKDEMGLYYFPFPQNKRVRMYVMEKDEMIWFRLWNIDVPSLWEEHGWIPYGAVNAAMEMYDGKNFDPKRAYDIEVAKSLLKEGVLNENE